MVSNLTQRPQGNDRAQVKGIYEGLCDIAIINNYYFGKLKYSEDPVQREWAKSMRLTFPNQEEGDMGPTLIYLVEEWQNTQRIKNQL